MQQGTDEWHKVKVGKFSGSSFADLMQKVTTKGFNDIINQIVYEKMTGEVPESFSNKWMDRGTELEPEAREHYEFLTFTKVKQVGFIELNDYVGISPDGLVGEKGGLEIKCPKYSTLLSYHFHNNGEEDYKWQLQGALYVTGRDFWDFFVYHPKLKPYRKRIYPNPIMQKDLHNRIEFAILEVEKRINFIKGL